MIARIFTRIIIPLFVTFGIPLLGLAVFSALPSGSAYACLPCNCPEDKRINCQGSEGYGVYTRVARDGSCSISVYLIDGAGRGLRAIRLTASEIEDLPTQPEENTLIENYRDLVQFYVLTTGEYQVNYGPDKERKVFTVIWTGCPAENIYESSYAPPDAAG
jgi:hypothetical protein